MSLCIKPLSTLTRARCARVHSAPVLQKGGMSRRHALGFLHLATHRQRTALLAPRAQRRSKLIDEMYDEEDEDIVMDSDEDVEDEDVMEAALDEEEEEEEEEDVMEPALETEEPESEPPVDSQEAVAEDEEMEMMLPCPKGFSLNFLWMEQNIAFAVDQIAGKDRRSPLTEYFVWPRTDAWEELEARLTQNSWIDEADRVLLLNRATAVINYWQDETTKHSLEEARAQFPDCFFMGT